MDDKKRSDSLLSKIQTRSLEIVLGPIAQSVSELMQLCSRSGQVPFPDLMPSALAVMEAVQDMANIAQKIVFESVDEELKSKMPQVSEMVLKIAERLLEAAGRLSEAPLSQHIKSMLSSAGQSILEWTVQLLLVWDEGEVKKIVNAAQWALDRLGLVQGSKSMRGLVICFGGFSEAMLLLLPLADKRQKDLTDVECKQQLLNILEKLKVTLPKFTEAMQSYIKSPNAPSAKVTKDLLGGELAAALHQLMDVVHPLNREADNMAGNIMEVQRKLTTDRRYYIGPDLDRHLDGVIQNSMAVAHVSRDQYRDAIQKLCGEILSLRKRLQDLAEAICNNPDDESSKMSFDQTASRLQERLVELDRWVADSVVDQVTETFVEPSAPMHHLVHAATSPGHTYFSPSSTGTGISASTTSPDSSPYSTHNDDLMKGLTKQVDLFRRHSRRLSQVAAHAAQSSTNAKRVQTIKVLANRVDKLTPRVVEAVLEVRGDQTNQIAREQLEIVRREWAEKVKELTGAIDDIIDPEDFMAVSEANIQQDMAQCKEALREGNWRQLDKIVAGIAAKARRISEFGHSAVQEAIDHSFKTSLFQAVSHLDKAIPKMLQLCKRLLTNPTNQSAQDNFVGSLRQLLEAIHDIQNVLSNEIDVSNIEEVDYSPAHSPQRPAGERMLQRNIGRQHYIGRLQTPASQSGGHSQPVSRTANMQAQTSSQSLEDSTHSHRRKKDKSFQTDLTDSLGTVSPGGVSGSSSISGRPSPTKPTPTPPTESYVSPLTRLVKAAERGDKKDLPTLASNLSSRAIRLTSIAESAAETLKPDTELAKTLKSRSSRVRDMVPQVIDKAKEVAHNPASLNQLHISTQKWAGHVRQLVDATQKANLPWSQTADNLVSAAASGVGVNKQISHVSTQTERMLNVAMATIEAAMTEEAIGNSDDSFQSADVELQEQVQQVKVTMREIRKLTPQFLAAAQAASTQPAGSATVEHLHLLSQEWATKAKVLMKGVDDVSLGMGGAADTLLLSARSGDLSFLSEQSENIQTLATTLGEIAEDALEGCGNSEQTQVVRETSNNLRKLSKRLTKVASSLAQEEEGGGGKQATVEDSEILRRDWSSQVHLLTAHVDELIAEVAAPLDRLVDIALQASRTSKGPAKELLLRQFEQRASFINDQLRTVGKLFHTAVDPIEGRGRRVAKINQSLSFLEKLTPHVIGAARSLSNDPGSAMLDHYNHLRRQWAAKAQHLLANLRKSHVPHLSAVLAAFLELLHTTQLTVDKAVQGSPPPIQRSYSDEALNEEKMTDLPDGSAPGLTDSKETSDLFHSSVPVRSKRPASMVIPLPTWAGSREESDDPYSLSSQSIAVAAATLREVTDEFMADNNPILIVAKKMSSQMSQMAEFSRGRGELQNQSEMIDTAKAIAANGQTIVRFAGIIGDHCTDRTIRNELQYCAEMIPTLSTQLRIIATVKASTPNDSSADVMLVKNAQNLMKAVIKTVQAAEAACMKGLHTPDSDEEEEQVEAAELAMGWKRKLYQQRTLESLRAPRDARGMRKLNKNRISTPSVLDTIKPRRSLLTSPPHRHNKDSY